MDPSSSSVRRVRGPRRPVTFIAAPRPPTSSSNLTPFDTFKRRTSLPPVTERPRGIKCVHGERIHRGRYTDIYIALNVDSGQMIAVKQFEITDSDGERQISALQAIKLESKILKELSHPNVVQYIGYEETDSFFTIQMEYIPGGSVANCLRWHGKFNENATRTFMSQLLSGLKYLHSKGVIHRNLQPQNILIDASGTCKISNFSLSYCINRTNSMGCHRSMHDTVFWIAPEVVKAEMKGFSTKNDIWSLGCVFLEMFTGKPPWFGEAAVPVLLKLFEGNMPPMPSDATLSSLADDFRRQCFAVEPDKRPSAIELRAHPYLSKTAPQITRAEWKTTNSRHAIRRSVVDDRE